MNDVPTRIAFFLRSIGGGGAEGAMINLARGFAERGYKVDFVLGSASSPHLWRIPPEVKIVDLSAPSLPASFNALKQYLRQEQPIALLSALHYSNEVAILAKRFSGVSTRVLVCEQNTLSQRAKHDARLSGRLSPLAARLSYPLADVIVAISNGVAEDLIDATGISSERIEVIYNPAIAPDIVTRSEEAIDHPWFGPGQPPVILGVGKMEPQKDFPTLIRAFAQVRQTRPAKLVILGWGPEREQLEALAKELGVEQDVSLPGYVKNPYPYMAKAAVFTLSSAWEGFGNVVAEALALGTPVVSTNCRSGPSEILNNGAYGYLTPVGDSSALAESIGSVLSGNAKPIDPDWLEQFSIKAVTQHYCNALGIA
ncbi:glycosyltransferase [Oculatella sp. LEGE 06141]|uniref:glycosyltransferase n=1 Tax=Oculatella sp. LEGE 06141 TaxID=1828648 RepID=UPI001880369E|nr:glycosyltransferase [Oculatella sp. LEGE 06141]MBE9178834.1 glycosyltransferase [Oculatella sp. LEGE 06141]